MTVQPVPPVLIDIIGQRGENIYDSVRRMGLGGATADMTDAQAAVAYAQYLIDSFPDTDLTELLELAAEAAASAEAAADSASSVATQVVETMSDLKAITASNAAARPTAILRSYAALGDRGGGNFLWNASDSRSDDGATIINPTGHSGNGRWNRDITDHISVNWWNPAIDQTGDAGSALRSAIAAAVVWKVREIRSFGKLRFTTQICNATYGWTLPVGLTFRGIGQQRATVGSSTQNSLWFYDGSANTDMFDIRGATAGAFGGAGSNVTFEDLEIATADDCGFMSINLKKQDGSTYTAPVDGVTPAGAQAFHFRNITASGHFKRWFFAGRNCFEFIFDDDCYIANFLRGVQLSGCDDCYVGGRFEGNASRHIMVEKQGTYGNSNRLAPSFLGVNGGSDSSEDHYAIFDSGESTYMDSLYAEVDGNNIKAILYLGGSATRIVCPKMYGINTPPPYFHLGPFAVNVVMICPDAPQPSAIDHPIIDQQDSSTFFLTGGYDNYNIQIINPSTTVTSRVNTDRRCCIVGGSIKLLGTNRSGLPQMALGENGPTLARYQASAQDMGNAAPISVGMTSLVPDLTVANYNQQAIQMPTTNGDGIYWRFVCNRDFISGDQLKFRAWVRCTAVPGAGNLQFSTRKNGTVQTSVTTTSNTYVLLERTLDTTGYATNDTVDMLVLNNGMSVAGLIGMVEMINTSV
jgi:hypothetical protein